MMRTLSCRTLTCQCGRCFRKMVSQMCFAMLCWREWQVCHCIEMCNTFVQTPDSEFNTKKTLIAQGPGIRIFHPVASCSIVRATCLRLSCCYGIEMLWEIFKDSFANDTQILDSSFIAETLLSLVDPRGGSIIAPRPSFFYIPFDSLPRGPAHWIFYILHHSTCFDALCRGVVNVNHLRWFIPLNQAAMPTARHRRVAAVCRLSQVSESTTSKLLRFSCKAWGRGVNGC